MLDFGLRDFCYGCGACVNACPRTAIRLVQAEDGSYIPEIDEGKCIQCGKCDRICIHLNSSKYHIHAIMDAGTSAAHTLTAQSTRRTDEEKKYENPAGE